MASQQNLEKFNKIYDKTYSDILRYVVIKCNDINNVNDIIQETYLEFWKILCKKEITDKNIKSFIIGIANNKIKKHYSLINKITCISLFAKNEDDNSLINVLKDKLDIEQLIINNDEWDSIWKYIKKKKNQNISKIFYLHYKLDLTIKEISKELNLSESYIKNSIYRTLNELSIIFEGEKDKNV